MKLSSVFLSLLLAGIVLLGACTQPASQPSPAPTTSPAVPATSGPRDVSLTPGATQPPGNPDPAFEVDVYKPGKAWPGTTLFADNHDPARPRIVEVNMLGEVTWEYVLPDELKEFTHPGEDVEPLPNGNLLVLFPWKGVYEITRGKEVVWKYLNRKVSHDADRLPNGNTLIAFGGGDTMEDMQVKEVSPGGEIVWSWRAKDSFNREPYSGIFNEGWTHTNAVTRLPNGNTLISPRNFNLLVEVDRSGRVIRTIGDSLIESQHDPEVQPDGNILMINQALPMSAIEMAPNGTILWKLVIPDPNANPVRDANRLPNGNTLITGVDRILEVTPDKELVWRLRLKGIVYTDKQLARAQGFYKAERV